MVEKKEKIIEMTQIDLERGNGSTHQGQGSDSVSRRNLTLNLTSDQTSSSNDENTVKRRSQPLISDHHRGYDSGNSFYAKLFKIIWFIIYDHVKVCQCCKVCTQVSKEQS